MQKQTIGTYISDREYFCLHDLPLWALHNIIGSAKACNDPFEEFIIYEQIYY